MMKMFSLAMCVCLTACTFGRVDAEEKAQELLGGEDVLCSGDTNGCGGGAGWTCVGRRTGREVYCSAHSTGRCVISDPVGINILNLSAEKPQ